MIGNTNEADMEIKYCPNEGLPKVEELLMSTNASDIEISALNMFECNYYELVNSLNEVCFKLDIILDNSEKEFLAIGSQLDKYLLRSREIVNLSSRIAAVFLGQELKKGIEELERLKKKLSDDSTLSSGKIKSDGHELLLILEKVEQTVVMLYGFKKIVKHSRMLCSATRIESSRLGVGENGFNILAANVDVLSNLINDKSEILSKKTAYLLREIYKTTSNLIKIDKEHHYQSAMILNRVEISLKAFKMKWESFVKAEIISKNYEQVNSDIYDIVTLIQIHDFTRQQIEAAKSELFEIKVKIEESYREYNLYDMNAILTNAHNVCNYHINQLDNTFKKFESAVLCIILKLKNVDESLTAILTESHRASEGNWESEEFSFQDVKKELALISEGLNNNINIKEQLTNSVASVITLIEDLTTSIVDIEDVGSDMEIVALNAIIKSARAGLKQSALGIIAESIKRLSVETKIQTGLTADLLKIIVDKSNSLKLKAQLNSEDENLSLLEANIKINKILDPLIVMEKDSHCLIHKLKKETLVLKKEIRSTAKRITVHKLTGFVLDQALNRLNAIVSSIKKTVNIDETIPICGGTDSLLAEVQRDPSFKVGVEDVNQIENFELF